MTKTPIFVIKKRNPLQIPLHELEAMGLEPMTSRV